MKNVIFNQVVGHVIEQVSFTSNDGKVLILVRDWDQKKINVNNVNNSSYGVLFGKEGEDVETYGFTPLFKWSKPDSHGQVKAICAPNARKIFFEEYVNNLEKINFK